MPVEQRIALVKQGELNLAPIILKDEPPEAYAKALAAAEELGWEVAAQSEARFVFDAREETRLFRFVDDITIRVRGEGNGSKIDIRSKSRDGKSDLGANAPRIRRFVEAIQ